MKKGTTNYEQFGLDTTKKSKDNDFISKSYWCLWCDTTYKTGGHFSLCFSNFVVCKSCANSAIEDKARWEATDYCFKCRKPKERAFKSHGNIGNTLHLCEDCIIWAQEVLTDKPKEEMPKQEITSDIPGTQARHPLRKYKGYQLIDGGAYLETGDNKLEIENKAGDIVHTVYFSRIDSNSLNKSIERAKEWINEQTTIETAADQPITEPQAYIINHSTLNNNDMNFFEQLAATGDNIVTLKIMKSNDILTVEYDPGLKAKGLKPVHLSGTAQELDEGFFTAILPQVKEIQGIVSNLAEVKKQAEQLAEKGTGDKDSESDTKSERQEKPATKSVRKPAKKKTPPKKVVEKKAKQDEPIKQEDANLFNTAEEPDTE